MFIRLAGGIITASVAFATILVVTRTASGKRVFVPRMDGYVEEDGTEGPNEDFSNNIEYFLFNPKNLHERTPKVYDWIRKRYGEEFKLRGLKK